ncbi:hypothetical protein IJD15_02835 [bacterium]|nr:hypothetical protein [bacterium]
MKIVSINSFYKTNLFNRQQSETNNVYKFKNNLMADVVSFRAKNYGIESIVNPTGHCAYCGCKVYNEGQIDALAKGMLGSKSHRLQGNIRSVLEKLDSAVRSEELTFAKKVENEEEITFFKRFLRISAEKSHLSGSEIFKEVDGVDGEEAFNILKENMKPLMLTIDHVSPQNLDEENNNVDSNLVEACYCCNHDLKKGVTFPEFYAMFPSIKENMPPEKFDYAYSNLMSSASASTILNRMSATNLLKHLQRLLGQRNDEIDRVKSTEFRIMEASSNIDTSIQTCKEEIASKEQKKREAEEKLDSLSHDDEYNALTKRLSLVQQSKQLETVIQSLRERRRGVSDSLNEIRNPSKKQKKQSKINMSDSEKEEKIKSLKATLDELSGEIKVQEEAKDTVDLEIMELDDKFPTVEILQGRKSKADSLVTAHVNLIRERENLAQLTKSRDALDSQIAQLKSDIAKYPKEDFDSSKYPQDEQEKYKRYLQCLEAIKHINTHSSGDGVKAVINLAAKPFIEAEIEQLKKEPIVVASNDFITRKELQSQLEAAQEKRTKVGNAMNASNKQITGLSRTTAEKTQEEATLESQSIAAHIRRLNEKQTYLELPKIISSLAAEILLLKQTVADLTAKQSQIKDLNTIQA